MVIGVTILIREDMSSFRMAIAAYLLKLDARVSLLKDLVKKMKQKLCFSGSHCGLERL